MDIYKQRSRWKIVLAIVGAVILAITTIYSNYLANKLKVNEEKNTYIYTAALKDLLSPVEESGSFSSLDQSVELQDTIIKAFPLPVIFEDEQGNLTGYNWGADKNGDTAFLEKKKAAFLKTAQSPIEGVGYMKKIYHFNSPLLAYIKYYPLLQILMVGLFILFGYFTFSSSRKAEQNRVWAGMAKETAHQLGTPISAILAWIEHLKTTTKNEEQLEIVEELTKDVNRLELVADRFSKIGSAPALEKTNVYNELDACRQYMERRASRRVTFDFPPTSSPPIYVHINQHLFDWVIENLIRNSLDAMDGQGRISAAVSTDNKFVIIDLTDTGKGIASSNFKTVFQPGYSTKSRGWGLGLSLAKRIIEGYHNGKIFVKSSKPEVGTTFTIKLPIVN